MAFMTRYPYHEQHIAYPLPETYYKDKPASRDLFKVFVDTPEKRLQRREFFADSLNERTLPPGKTKVDFLQELELLDMKITDEKISKKEQECLIEKRAKLFKPILENFFHGVLNTKEEHLAVMKQYKELTGDVANRLGFIPVALIYYGKMLKRIYEGSSRKLAKIVEEANKKGANIDISFVILERDEIIKPTDIDNVKNQLSHDKAYNELPLFFLMEQMAHSSIGYYP